MKHVTGKSQGKIFASVYQDGGRVFGAKVESEVSIPQCEVQQMRKILWQNTRAAMARVLAKAARAVETQISVRKCSGCLSQTLISRLANLETCSLFNIIKDFCS